MDGGVFVRGILALHRRWPVLSWPHTVFIPGVARGKPGGAGGHPFARLGHYHGRLRAPSMEKVV